MFSRKWFNDSFFNSIYVNISHVCQNLVYKKCIAQLIEKKKKIETAVSRFVVVVKRETVSGIMWTLSHISMTTPRFPGQKKNSRAPTKMINRCQVLSQYMNRDQQHKKLHPIVLKHWNSSTKSVFEICASFTCSSSHFSI